MMYQCSHNWDTNTYYVYCIHKKIKLVVVLHDYMCSSLPLKTHQHLLTVHSCRFQMDQWLVGRSNFEYHTKCTVYKINKIFMGVEDPSYLQYTWGTWYCSWYMRGCWVLRDQQIWDNQRQYSCQPWVSRMMRMWARDRNFALCHSACLGPEGSEWQLAGKAMAAEHHTLLSWWSGRMTDTRAYQNHHRPCTDEDKVYNQTCWCRTVHCRARWSSQFWPLPFF